MPRIAPVTGKADVAPEYHDVVDQVQAVFGNVRGPFSIMLHSPKLAERMLKLVTFNREDSVVPAPLRSLAILAAVREKEALAAPAFRKPPSTCSGLRAIPAGCRRSNAISLRTRAS